MIEVKCFTFYTTHTLPASVVEAVSEDEYGNPVLRINGQALTTSLRLTGTNPQVREYDANDILDGFFIETFMPIDHRVQEDNATITIHSTFILEFDPGPESYLEDNELCYAPGECVYRYRVTPSFCRAEFPALSESIEVESQSTLEIDVAIKEMRR